MRYPTRLAQMMEKSLTQLIRSEASDIVSTARKDNLSPPSVLVSINTLVCHQPLKASILDYRLSVTIVVFPIFRETFDFGPKLLHKRFACSTQPID